MGLDGDGRCNWCGDNGAEHKCPECGKIGDLGFICPPHQTSKVVNLGTAQHQDFIPKWPGTLEELAQSIENMRYDKVSEFLSYLAKALVKRSKKDLKDGKKVLGTRLDIAAFHVMEAKTHMSMAWKLCKPHMKEEKDNC